ncbi:UDP-glycosyltransferase-13 [Ephemera danica]|nr:UDP-glycosyltransferase-13 [Ephemera danica]
MRAINFCILVASLSAFTTSDVHGARILVLLGFSGKSHNHGIGEVTSELALKGHDITVVTPFPVKNPPGKYRVIDVPITRELMGTFDMMKHTNQNIVQKLNTFWSLAAEHCPRMLNMPEVKSLLNEKFDLVILSMFFNDCFLPFAYHNKAPLIMFSPSGMMSWVGTNVGNPEPTAYVPSIFLPFSHEMTFMQRFGNTLAYYFLQFMREFVLAPKMNVAVKEVFGPNIPSILDIEKNASLVLLNTHCSLNYPRPLQPNVVEVGGMHIKTKVVALPKDLQDFMDGAKDGVIYFSMGSAVRPEDFPTEMVEAIVETFKILPQRVIFKWNLDTLPGKPSNVKIGKWLPQEAILAHPNTRLFITHGGLLSTQEAAYYGVPLIGIPVLGDQQLNVKQSEFIGFAVGIDFRNVTKMSLLEAVHRVLNTKTYSEKAKQLRQRVRDQPESPLDRAVFWIEYVLRHEGAHHLRPAATHLAWYQLYLIDVTAVLLAVLILVYITLRALFRLVCGSKKQSQRMDKKKKQ